MENKTYYRLMQGEFILADFYNYFLAIQNAKSLSKKIKKFEVDIKIQLICNYYNESKNDWDVKIIDF